VEGGQASPSSAATMELPVWEKGMLSFAIGYGVWTDWKSWKIRNHLTFPLILAGVVIRGWQGVWSEMAVGFLLGFLPLFLLFLAGGMGAGDVKFGAGLGVWLGGEGMLRAYAVSGLVLLLYLLLSGRLVAVLRNLPAAFRALSGPKGDLRATRIPYGVFLGLGALVSLWTGG